MALSLVGLDPDPNTAAIAAGAVWRVNSVHELGFGSVAAQEPPIRALTGFKAGGVQEFIVKVRFSRGRDADP